MNTEFAKSTGNGIGAFLEALLLFLLAVAGQASLVRAQSGGTFTATGSMTSARAGHTATLLRNGKVLIAGGYGNASAELYDPSAGTFAPTGHMTGARAGHAATLLPDGRVLIAAGFTLQSGQQAVATAELYDPSTGTFTATGDMVFAPGFLSTATLLGNGKVLIAGGGPTAQLYDSATGTFAVTGAYAGSYTRPFVDTATLLQDGRVLITGCDCFGAAPVIELYGPGTNTFSLTGTRNGTVGWWGDVNTATLLMNGKVLVAGSDEYDWSADAEVYDPSTGTVTSIGYMTAPHEFSTATLLPDGQVLVAGSQLPGGSSLSSAELYDSETGTFHAAGNMTAPRFQHTATLLPNGEVLMSGGYSPWPAPTSSAELYTPGRVQGTPTVRIMDNDTGSLTTLAVGDSFSFQVSGAPPISLVSVSEPGWSGSVGYTDASGLFWLSGVVGSNVVGTWQQTWTIGGVAAQPSPLQFTISPKP
jgi:Galactose oxidase, central domain